MTDHGFRELLGKQLRQSGYEIVDAIPIPMRGDRMVRLRTLQEALEDFESTDDDQTVGYFVQIKPHVEPKAHLEDGARHHGTSGKIAEYFEEEHPHGSVPKISESMFQPDGKLNVPFLIKNAELLVSTGDYALARNIYKSIISSGERTATGLFGMAQCFLAEGRHDEAARKFEESITYQPSLEAYQRLAQILMQQSKDRQAGETMERALNLKDLPPATRFELHKACGNCFTRGGKHADADKHYRKALAIQPSADEISANLGTLHLQASKLYEAKRFFQDAAAANPRNAKALAGLAACALSEGDKRAAHDQFAKSLDIELGNPTAIYHLVKCAYELRSYATAARILENYVQAAPVNANLLYSLAGLQYHLGRLNDSRQTAQRILSISPNHAGARELLTLIGTLADRTGPNLTN